MPVQNTKTDNSVPSRMGAYLSGHGAAKEAIAEQPLGLVNL